MTSIPRFDNVPRAGKTASPISRMAPWVGIAGGSIAEGHAAHQYWHHTSRQGCVDRMAGSPGVTSRPVAYLVNPVRFGEVTEVTWSCPLSLEK